jgi:hypothetical protein
VILTYDKRQAYWNWCREFIDREAIYRADDTGSACGCAPPAARLAQGGVAAFRTDGFA